MKGILKYSGYFMIAFVVVCVLSLFWFVQFRSPSSKESFESDDKKKFTLKYSEDAPGKKGDEFYIDKDKKLINSSSGDSVHNQLKFEKKDNEIIGQLRFETIDSNSSSSSSGNNKNSSSDNSDNKNNNK